MPGPRAPGSPEKRLAIFAAVLAVVLIAGAVVLDAVSNHEPSSTSQASPAPSPTPSRSPNSKQPEPREDRKHVSVVARARRPQIQIFRRYRSKEPWQTLDHPTAVGGPLVFLVKKERDDRLNVSLPIRPNGSTGWIDARDVKLSEHPYRIVVERGRHRITVFRGDKIFLRRPVAIGTADTPTPGGTYYIKELLQPPDPTGPYGPYAYGLSGFSNALTSFAGGEGVIGIHGTNEPGVIGTDVSHGCIRMRNEDIRRLVPVLPLGTPVRIEA